MKIATIVGARPQFIKAAPVGRAIQKHNQDKSNTPITEVLVHTGQHYDYNMSQVFFDELEIQAPDYHLGVGSGTHGKMTGAMLERIEKVLLDEQPDWVLVYGDTNSTLAGALAAAKLHIPVAHVEAGLRSFNRCMPEEINRVLTDHISTLLFCPTKTAVVNLENESIRQDVYRVGDVMYDAVLYYRNKAKINGQDRPTPYVLASLHRAENTDDPKRLGSIFSAMGVSPIPVILPLHPRTRKLMKHNNLSTNNRIEILEPQSYLNMLKYLDRCTFVITDSGGLQKEAYFFGKRCITVRDETEWTELVECGANRVAGAEESVIRSTFSWAMEPLLNTPELYGSGNASERIIHHLTHLIE
jgi:UDP-GlcNAc3NAcA epimerase